MMVLKRQWKECNERQSGVHRWGGESKCRCRTVCAVRRRYAAERLILCSTLCRATRNRHSPSHVCVCVCLHVIALPCHHFASFSPLLSPPLLRTHAAASSHGRLVGAIVFHFPGLAPVPAGVVDRRYASISGDRGGGLALHER